MAEISDEVETKFSEQSDFPKVAEELSSKKRKESSTHLPSETKRKYAGMKANELRAILSSDAIQFCQDLKLIATSVTCYCGDQAILVGRRETNDGCFWSCRKTKLHYGRMSIRKGSWFENSRLTIPDILWIAYMWIYEYSFISMLHECSQSDQTLTDWCCKFQDSCQVILECKSDPIGGSDKLVEIFEGRFKDYRLSKKASRVSKKDSSNQWVFCAIEQFSTNSIFLIVQDKNSDTLREVFDKYILPGTTVFSNVWNAYKDLSSESFDYLTNEKLLTFHDSYTKTDLDTFDTFQTITQRTCLHYNDWNKFEYDVTFCEYMYRRSLSFAPDAYLAFLNDMAKIYKPFDRIIQKSAD